MFFSIAADVVNGQIERVLAGLRAQLAELEVDLVGRIVPCPDVRLAYPQHRQEDAGTNTQLFKDWIAAVPELMDFERPDLRAYVVQAIRAAGMTVARFAWSFGAQRANLVEIVAEAAVRAVAQQLAAQFDRPQLFPENSLGWRQWKHDHMKYTQNGKASGQLLASLLAAEVSIERR